jgi:hypothetical protein
MKRREFLKTVGIVSLPMPGTIVLGEEKSSVDPKQESPISNISVTELQENFRKLQFGMFIHYTWQSEI